MQHVQSDLQFQEQRSSKFDLQHLNEAEGQAL